MKLFDDVNSYVLPADFYSGTTTSNQEKNKTTLLALSVLAGLVLAVSAYYMRKYYKKSPNNLFQTILPSLGIVLGASLLTVSLTFLFEDWVKKEVNDRHYLSIRDIKDDITNHMDEYYDLCTIIFSSLEKKKLFSLKKDQASIYSFLTEVMTKENGVKSFGFSLRPLNFLKSSLSKPNENSIIFQIIKRLIKASTCEIRVVLDCDCLKFWTQSGVKDLVLKGSELILSDQKVMGSVTFLELECDKMDGEQITKISSMFPNLQELILKGAVEKGSYRCFIKMHLLRLRCLGISSEIKIYLPPTGLITVECIDCKKVQIRFV